MERYTKDELKALGAMYKVVSETVPGGLTDLEIDNAYSHPLSRFATVHRRLVRSGKLTERVQNIITSLLDSVEPREKAPEPLTLEEQGWFAIGYGTMGTDLVSVKEAAEIIGVTVQRVYQMAKDEDGGLRALTIDGKMMFPRVGVERFAKKHEA